MGTGGEQGAGRTWKEIRIEVGRTILEPENNVAAYTPCLMNTKVRVIVLGAPFDLAAVHELHDCMRVMSQER